MGKCPKGKARKRSMAQAGDVICVTGSLGDSGAGLKLLPDRTDLTAQERVLVERHLMPEPRIPEGLFLSSFQGVHAMMDISDGIASDLRFILDKSRKQAVVDVEHLPLSDELVRVASERHWDALELALAGGEDYELLLTVAADEYPTIGKKFQDRFNKPLFAIGSIVEGDSKIHWMKNEAEYKFSKSGFDHFAQ
jgi:thiamine-monophosphate kinase